MGRSHANSLPSHFEHRVAGFQDSGEVGVQVPVAVLGFRIAPAHQEHLLATAHEVLDKAAARRQIQYLVTVDLWWNHEDWTFMNSFGGGRVLDEFQYGVARNHCAWCGRNGLAGYEGAAVDHRWQPAVGFYIVQRVPCPVPQATAARFGGFFDGGWVA